MAANQLVQTRIDGAIKEEAAAVLAAMGLTVSDAVTNVGQPLYVAGDGTSRITALTTTATGNTLFGYALETKTATAAPIAVAIAQV